MPQDHVRVSGTWKEVNNLHVKVAGTWKRVRKGWVKVSGTWKLFRGGFVAMSGGTSLYIDPGVALFAGHEFTEDGIINGIGPGLGDRTQYVTGEWWDVEPDTGVGADYDVRCESIFAGSAWDTQPASVGTWIQMSSDRIWLNAVNLMMYPPGEVSSNGAYFEISETGNATPLVTKQLYVATVDNTDP